MTPKLKAFAGASVLIVAWTDAETSEGKIRVSAFELPVSTFLTPESRHALQRWEKAVGEALKVCPFDYQHPFSQESVRALRGCVAQQFWIPLVARHRSRYGVEIRPATISGVPTEIITPVEGVPLQNRKRVLINLHSGGFTAGARYGGQVESIPIAALGKIKIVSVDYRLAPEHRFPAATDDVVAVYRALLKDHEPTSIGIFGCSAGGLLTAQTTSRLQKEGLPVPGAVGMFCGAGSYWSEGDSGPIEAAITGHPPDTVDQHPYFDDADPNDPLVFPTRSPEVLAKFPPSLLISATRDQALSSVVHMHSRLIALGAEADLHVWEGLGHAFFYDPDLPQAREVYDVTVKFFERHLGEAGASN
jgi:epsilon-lactone hydrolase